ncbi:hypothetical protein Asi03nite_02460 [Actinoplanes siamensis]|uniref:Uncharacterized protein n=1 Tax=Actinoplanes siamensis TaxID=1223317 RepID=A0A919KAU8_9ACTN|nr:hypothetical protein Asi03nite_02460 [Actinoplanes siamensis]
MGAPDSSVSPGHGIRQGSRPSILIRPGREPARTGPASWRHGRDLGPCHAGPPGTTLREGTGEEDGDADSYDPDRHQIVSSPSAGSPRIVRPPGLAGQGHRSRPRRAGTAAIPYWRGAWTAIDHPHEPCAAY